MVAGDASGMRAALAANSLYLSLSNLSADTTLAASSYNNKTCGSFSGVCQRAWLRLRSDAAVPVAEPRRGSKALASSLRVLE